jgi:hypothetical protein
VVEQDAEAPARPGIEVAHEVLEFVHPLEPLDDHADLEPALVGAVEQLIDFVTDGAA